MGTRSHLRRVYSDDGLTGCIRPYSGCSLRTPLPAAETRFGPATLRPAGWGASLPERPSGLAQRHLRALRKITRRRAHRANRAIASARPARALHSVRAHRPRRDATVPVGVATGAGSVARPARAAWPPVGAAGEARKGPRSDGVDLREAPQPCAATCRESSGIRAALLTVTAAGDARELVRTTGRKAAVAVAAVVVSPPVRVRVRRNATLLAVAATGDARVRDGVFEGEPHVARAVGPLNAATALMVIDVNYFCRSATTILAGSRQIPVLVSSGRSSRASSLGSS